MQVCPTLPRALSHSAPGWGRVGHFAAMNKLKYFNYCKLFALLAEFFTHFRIYLLGNEIKIYHSDIILLEIKIKC